WISCRKSATPEGLPFPSSAPSVSWTMAPSRRREFLPVSIWHCTSLIRCAERRSPLKQRITWTTKDSHAAECCFAQDGLPRPRFNRRPARRVEEGALPRGTARGVAGDSAECLVAGNQSAPG